MKCKRILILSNDDFPYEGHGYPTWKHFLSKGFEAYFVCYESRYSSDSLHFIGRETILGKFFYLVEKRLRRKKFNVYPGKDEYCLLNTSFHYYGSAKRILQKIGVIPDAIIFTWCDFFISPKTFYELYQLTGAKMVIIMVDAHLLGGGCHYPCDCRQYETGCKECPLLKLKFPARKLFEEKKKYLGQVPLTIIGTPYDIQRTSNVSFLSHSERIKQISIPSIPFVLSKKEARNVLKLPTDDFVVMIGAKNLKDKRKGFDLLMKALSNFSKRMNESRKMTLLMLGDPEKSNFDFALLSDRMNIVQPGLLDEKGLFMAYYASDLFVSSSIDDSGPMMVNYSIACGTPVLSFPIGVSVELVQHMKTGYIADFMSIQSLEDGIDFFYRLTENELDAFRNNCLSLMSEYRDSEANRPWYHKVFES